jgi:2-amino-4-hydroxy-6-hydroxymethyldihydropteridine diphosphokinase
MPFIYLGLGTNLGDRLANLRSAIDAIADFAKVADVSRIYETAPVGMLDQPSFLNMALLIESDLEPLPLLKRLKDIEKDLGRTESVRWGPRLIDIDILLYDDLKFEDEALDIPHPRMTERRFAMAPLAEIAPHVTHPVLGKTITELLGSLPPDDGVKIFEG